MSSSVYRDFIFAVKGKELQADICFYLWERCWELGFLTLHTCVAGYCLAGLQHFCFVILEEDG